jgi:hypothetical protein
MDELLNAVLDSMVRNNIMIKEMPQHLNNYLPKEEWISAGQSWRGAGIALACRGSGT